MRIAPVLVKAGIIAISILVPILLLTSIYPLFVPGNIQVDIPESEDWNIELVGSTMVVDIPIRIYNGAPSPITDFRVHLVMNDSHGVVVAEDSTDPLEIGVGRWTDVPVHLDVDLGGIPEETLDAIAFSNETLGMSVGVGASYFNKLIKATVDVGSDMALGPMVSDIELQLDQASIVQHGQEAYLHVPFSFSAQQLLEGHDLALECSLSNSTTLLGASSQSIEIHSSTAGEAVFHLEEGAAQHLLNDEDELVLDAGLEVLGAHLDQSYQSHWYPPEG